MVGVDLMKLPDNPLDVQEGISEQVGFSATSLTQGEGLTPNVALAVTRRTTFSGCTHVPLRAL